MKKLLTCALIAITLTAPVSSFAATKPVALQVGSVLTTPSGVENFIQSGKNTIYLSNIAAATSNILLTANDLTGTTAWQRTIDSGSDEVATAIALDPQGNIWLAGSASLPVQIESATSLTGIDNPDAVTLDPAAPLRTDMNQLALWKVSPAGELLATYLSPQIGLPEITAISINPSGISMIGQLDSKSFYISASLTGTFSQAVTIGSSKTVLNSVIRSSDGGAYVVGSSAEVLAGKKVAGKRDGVLIKFSKSGAITSLLRSSANGASRGWVSADPSLTLAGYVATGKKMEVAITKFTTTFAPTWTARFSATGDTALTTGAGNSYLAITSTSAIAGVTGWKATSPGLIVLTFDGKGVIKAAHSFPGLVRPINLQYTRERGVIGLATMGDGSISIFTLISR